MTTSVADLDTENLESFLEKTFLEESLDASVTDVEVLAEGLNSMVTISTTAGERYLLRRPNKLRDTALFTDLRQEYRLLEILDETALPTPEPIAFCADESILGAPFFVVTYLDGEPIPLGEDLPERFQHPAARERLAHRLIDTLAEIHTLPTDRFETVCNHGTARDQVEIGLDRLDVATGVTDYDPPGLRSVGEWLLGNAPSDRDAATDRESTLVHGDYRPGNALFGKSEDEKAEDEAQVGSLPTVTGVIDWETSMLGDPLTELGYLLLRWGEPDDPTPSLEEIEARHPDHDALSALREANEDGLAPFTRRPGSPDRRELIARYEAATGITYAHDRFYRAHAAFMLAVVWMDLHRHQVETAMAADPGAEPPSNWEPRVEYVTTVAEMIVDGTFGL